jgi:hypothetical protein
MIKANPTSAGCFSCEVSQSDELSCAVSVESMVDAIKQISFRVLEKPSGCVGRKISSLNHCRQ